MIRRRRSATRRTAKFATQAAKAALFSVVAIALLSRPAIAADLAILSNGFSIRHEHRLVMGATTRLFFGADDSSFTDVPTAEITGYEKDPFSSTPPSLSLPLRPPAGRRGRLSLRPFPPTLSLHYPCPL